MHGIDLLSRASIAMGQEDTSPNISTARTLSQVPPPIIWRVKTSCLCLLISWHFISPKRMLYFNVDKEASASGGLCPSSPLSGLCPWNCYVPPFMETDRPLCLFLCAISTLACGSGQQVMGISAGLVGFPWELEWISCLHMKESGKELECYRYCLWNFRSIKKLIFVHVSYFYLDTLC